MANVYLIRHGKTAGNMERRYVGSTDEPLCEAGIAEVNARRDHMMAVKQPGTVYVSPMLRCRQTAEILFPGAVQINVPDFREMDFGQFEYKNYEELAGDARYQAFIDSGGHLDFPGAEPQQQFRLRVRNAFIRCLKKNEAFMANLILDEPRKPLVFVLHGGTIMAILDAYARPHRDYFDWQTDPACGYHCEIRRENDTICLGNVTRI